jgi:hypothetical protein
MTSSGKKPKPLKPSEVKEVILEALGDEGSYREQPLSSTRGLIILSGT